MEWMAITTSAIIHFNTLINGLDDSRKKESSWFLSLAYLKAGQTENAKGILTTISKWDESTQARNWDKKIALQAKALLETMN